MAQATDYTIDNQVFPAVRGDINAVFQAVLTENSGPTAPTNPAAHMIWTDTSTTPATFRRRNSTNTAWYVVGLADTANMGFVSAANPVFTGSAFAPTPPAASNNGLIATTAYVLGANAAHGVWNNLFLLSGWTQAVGYPTSYRLTNDNRVELRGVITKNNPTSGENLFQLPVGARVATAYQLMGLTFGFPSVFLGMETSGFCTIQGAATGTVFVSLAFTLPLN